MIDSKNRTLNFIKSYKADKFKAQLKWGVYEHKRPPKYRPQIVGFPYIKDPFKVPRISDTPKLAHAKRSFGCASDLMTLLGIGCVWGAGVPEAEGRQGLHLQTRLPQPRIPFPRGASGIRGHTCFIGWSSLLFCMLCHPSWCRISTLPYMVLNVLHQGQHLKAPHNF